MTLSDLIQHDSALSYKSISEIQLSGEENYTITAEEDSVDAYQTDDLYYVEKDGKRIPLSTDRVESWLESLTTLNLTDYVTYNATEEELESYHLTEPELTITVDYTDRNDEAQTYSLSISRDPEELAAAEEAEANGEKADSVSAYVRVGASPLIYRLSEYNSKNLRSVSYNDLRHKEVLTADFETVTQLDITLEGESYTLVSEEGEKKDDERVWKYGETEIEVKDLKSKLTGLKVSYSDDFTDEKPSGKKELSLTVHLGHEQRPTVSIDLYRYDGEDCLAVVGGESFAFVSRKDVVDLIEAINDIVLN